MPSNEYFLSPENALNSDLDKINTEILIKSMSITINNKNNYEIEMQNYIYLTYIELWGFCYWYLDASEKDKKFLSA
jgi:nicotinamide riboside transporter PnuC